MRTALFGILAMLILTVLASLPGCVATVQDPYYDPYYAPARPAPSVIIVPGSNDPGPSPKRVRKRINACNISHNQCMANCNVLAGAQRNYCVTQCNANLQACQAQAYD